jgi:hypothetical protein
MEDILQFRESTPRPEERINCGSPEEMKRAGLCTYNQTGQRFISNDVEVVEASEGDFEDCYSTLLPGSGSAIWIVPARDLISTSFCIPVDLLYLNETYAVVATVELFPIHRVSPSIEHAASILALPANAIHTMGIEAGDQLMLCSPEDVQSYLQSARPPSLEASSDLGADNGEIRLPGREQGPGEVGEEMDASATSPALEPLAPSLIAGDSESESLGREQQFWKVSEQAGALATGLVPEPLAPPLEADSNLDAGAGDGKLLVWEQPPGKIREQREEIDALAIRSVLEPAKAEEGRHAPIATPPPPVNWKPFKGNWWRKLLLNEPLVQSVGELITEQRWGERKALPRLVVYFFTGGVPTPHQVRNVSMSGIYILTSERWYLGTYVRLTLTDVRQPRAERSITLHAKVIRSTDHGVALEFLFLERIGQLGNFGFIFNRLPGVSSSGLRRFLAQLESDS